MIMNHAILRKTFMNSMATPMPKGIINSPMPPETPPKEGIPHPPP